MRRLSLLAFLLLFAALFTSAQKSYILNPGEHLEDVIPKEEIYKYPSFKNGLVIMRDGSTIKALMNFHLIFMEVHFIDKKNDTLSLDDEATIRNVIIDKDTFNYHQGFEQVIMDHSDYKLTVREGLVITDKLISSGSYGFVPASYGTSLRSVLTRNDEKKLISSQTLVFSYQKQYYLVDINGDGVAANKKGFLHMFNSKRSEIEKFYASTKVNFNKQEDLESLFSYITTLNTQNQ